MQTTGADQHVHPCILISAFVVLCLDCIIPLVAISKISNLYIASVAAQASLSLPWSQTLQTGFLVTRLRLSSIMLPTPAVFQEWCHKLGQTIQSIFTWGCSLGKENIKGRKNRTQRYSGPQGHRMSNSVYRTGDTAGEVAAGSRERICVHIQATQCSWRHKISPTGKNFYPRISMQEKNTKMCF